MNKARFLRTLAPVFPDVSDTEARLQTLETALQGGEHWMQRHFQAVEEIYFPIWQALASAYVTTLTAPFGGDAIVLPVTVEHWPATMADQQQNLLHLLAQSRLRQGWRDYAKWFSDEYRKVVVVGTIRRCGAPMRGS